MNKSRLAETSLTQVWHHFRQKLSLTSVTGFVVHKCMIIHRKFDLGYFYDYNFKWNSYQEIIYYILITEGLYQQVLIKVILVVYYRAPWCTYQPQSPKFFPKKKFLHFLLEKFSLHFAKWNFLAKRLKTFLYFLKKSFSYILGHGTFFRKIH